MTNQALMIVVDGSIHLLIGDLDDGWRQAIYEGGYTGHMALDAGKVRPATPEEVAELDAEMHDYLSPPDGFYEHYGY